MSTQQQFLYCSQYQFLQVSGCELDHLRTEITFQTCIVGSTRANTNRFLTAQVNPRQQEDYEYFSTTSIYGSLIHRQPPPLTKNHQKVQLTLPIIEFMTEFALRNLPEYHYTLKEKIKGDKPQSRSQTAPISVILPSQSRAPSQKLTPIRHTHRKLFHQYQRRIGQQKEKLNSFLEKFLEVVNQSVMIIMQSFVICRFELEEDLLNLWVRKGKNCTCRQIQIFQYFPEAAIVVNKLRKAHGLQQQFLRDRAKKSQLAEIVTSFFNKSNILNQINSIECLS